MSFPSPANRHAQSLRSLTTLLPGRLLPGRLLPGRLLLQGLLLGSCVWLSGCGAVSSFSFPGVYRIDIPQGNIITQEMVDQLRPGLTKRQVTFILGTPLIRDTFDQDRWDYLYSFQPGGGERAQERLTVHFDNNVLTHISGDFEQTPENMQFPATAAPASQTSPGQPDSSSPLAVTSQAQ